MSELVGVSCPVCHRVRIFTVQTWNEMIQRKEKVVCFECEKAEKFSLPKFERAFFAVLIAYIVAVFLITFVFPIWR